MSKEALVAANAYLDYWLGSAMFVSLEERRQKLAEAFDAFAREHAADAWDYKEQHGRVCTFEDYWAWKVGEK